MKVLLIIAHQCVLPEAFNRFHEILSRLQQNLPNVRVASTSLANLEKDLLSILSEGAEAVSILPYLLLNGQHSKNDIPRTVSMVQNDFPQVPITLIPCIGDWDAFADMIVDGLREKTPVAEESSKFFAVEMNLKKRNVVIVGGGKIALRKVKSLLSTDANITVIAPEIHSELKTLDSRMALVERAYETKDLANAFMVFICTDNPAVNAQVRSDALAKNVLVNNACDFKNGDFIVPAQLHFGKSISVAVSTGGKSPALAKKLKQTIQETWKDPLEKIEREYFE